MLEAGHPLGQCLGAQTSFAFGIHHRGDLSLHGVAQLGRKPVEKRGVEGGRRHAGSLPDKAGAPKGMRSLRARVI